MPHIASSHRTPSCRTLLDFFTVITPPYNDNPSAPGYSNPSGSLVKYSKLCLLQGSSLVLPKLSPHNSTKPRCGCGGQLIYSWKEKTSRLGDNNKILVMWSRKNEFHSNIRLSTKATTRGASRLSPPNLSTTRTSDPTTSPAKRR